jgi:hypothetical protein
MAIYNLKFIRVMLHAYMSVFEFKPLKCGGEKSHDRGFMPVGLRGRALKDCLVS